MTRSTPGATRNTRQRGEVLALLEETDDFRTPQQLHLDLTQRGARVGLATVYRTLQMLVDAGEVDTMRMPTGEQLYRRCGRSHHHHLVCRGCATTVEVEGPAVERWADRLAAEHGFTDVSHTLEIFGTCPQCHHSATTVPPQCPPRCPPQRHATRVDLGEKRLPYIAALSSQDPR